ncbi:MAG: cysteamine dioxygenase, partial [Monoraphidium minutum]
ITYLHIHEDELMTIGIFQLPEGARIPLHNHPGMTVFSRLLFGSLHIRASTSCSAMSCSSMLGVRPARLVADRVLAAPCPTSVLFPADGGNIHSFTALSPCAVLDVLTPPYAPACGRDCTYYREAFPPQLLDDAGHPLLMPAEDVAAWVRWQQAARGGGAPPAPPLPPRRSSSGSSGGGDADMGDAAAAAHPWAALGGGEQGLVMGLEATPMPQDFLVDRGVYRGKGVRG